jgi:7-cyano-7-deazaguanine synthase in queuosine biosynthesis
MAATAGERAVHTIEVDLEVDEATIQARYQTDAGDAGAITVRYPPGVEIHPGLLPLVGGSLGVYLAQLCLAKRVQVGVPLDPSLRSTMQTLAGFLYDVRCWRDGRPFADHPELVGAGDVILPPRPASLVADRALLLWSGGKDSTLAAVRLREEGAAVVPVHVGVNRGVERREAEAVSALAPLLGLETVQLGYEHPEFDDFAARYASAWDIWPHANKVPFGRDLMLAALVLPLASWLRCSTVSFGHERDCRRAWVEHGGRRFPRNDVESREGAALLGAAMARAVPGLRLWSPLERTTELEVLRSMLVDHADLMARTSSCFWPGGRCGRCAKCLRYALAQRTFGVDVLSFDADPLADGVCPDLDELLAAPDERNVLFGRSTLYCLARLAERGDIRSGEDRLLQFARSDRYRGVLPDLDRWHEDLLPGAPLERSAARPALAESATSR